MKALPFTYLAKGRYWRFRHHAVGDVPLPAFGSAEFEPEYRRLIGKAGAIIREAEIARTLGINSNARNFYRLYFIEVVEGGPIKIGIARDPEARLRMLQIGNHARLALLAQAKGGRREEREAAPPLRRLLV